MQLTSQLKTLGGFIADLVFPVSCVVCGKDGEFLCSECLPKLSRLEKQLCIVCKKPAPYGKTHPDCVTRNTVDGIISAINYADPQSKKIVGTFKYEFIDKLSKPLSEMIVEAIAAQGLAGYFSEFIIIPVPLHKRRYNWRGFNQAELLANALADDLKIIVDKDIVERTTFTKPQTKLKADERKSNIEDAFRIIKPTNGKYLLVDDVVTTGSTLNEIAKLLKKQGATEVWATTVAHG